MVGMAGSLGNELCRVNAARVLCNLIGRDVENGEIPDDDSLIGPMIRNICYNNAKQYLAFPMGEVSASGKRSTARVK